MQQHRERAGRSACDSARDQVRSRRASVIGRPESIRHGFRAGSCPACGRGSGLEQDVVAEQREAEEQVDQRAGPRPARSRVPAGQHELGGTRSSKSEQRPSRGRRPGSQPGQLELTSRAPAFPRRAAGADQAAGRHRDSRGRSHVLILSLSLRGSECRWLISGHGVGKSSMARSDLPSPFHHLRGARRDRVGLPVVLTIYAQLSGPQQHR